MFIESFRVESPHVRYGPTEIESEYRYDTTELVHEGKDGASRWVVRPKSVKYNFRTSTAVPKLGVMLVGWGGNNGSTLTAGVIANREGISWATKDKVQQANYFGSLTQASTIRVGSYNGEEIYAPFKSLLPMMVSRSRWISPKGCSASCHASAMPRPLSPLLARRSRPRSRLLARCPLRLRLLPSSPRHQGR